MAYAASTATDFAKLMAKSMPVQDVRVHICDEIARIMWMAAPWRWTLGSLASFVLAPDTQDYTFTKPGDFLYLSRAYIFDGKQNKDLEIVGTLPDAVWTPGMPSKIAYMSSGGDKLRFEPVPSASGASQRVITLYKKTYTPITVANIATAGALLFPDEWASVFEEGVLWKVYQYADDQRAGTAQVSGDGQIQYNGQLGVFMAALQVMKETEKPLLIYPGFPAQKS